MTTIEKHLAKETNSEMITELQKILTRGTLTFSQWSATGKFFYKNKSERKTLKSCAQVIEYVGDVYIQVLEDGEFYYTSKIRGKSLYDVEKLVWKVISEKLWCENC
jgi:hypothetical protein